MDLDLSPALSHLDLLAKPVAAALSDWPAGADVEVAPIDPDLAEPGLGQMHQWRPAGSDPAAPSSGYAAVARKP